jgi:hypothetical protein
LARGAQSGRKRRWHWCPCARRAAAGSLTKLLPFSLSMALGCLLVMDALALATLSDTTMGSWERHGPWWVQCMPLARTTHVVSIYIIGNALNRASVRPDAPLLDHDASPTTHAPSFLKKLIIHLLLSTHSSSYMLRMATGPLKGRDGGLEGGW